VLQSIDASWDAAEVTRTLLKGCFPCVIERFSRYRFLTRKVSVDSAAFLKPAASIKSAHGSSRKPALIKTALPLSR
jgi:hypothetical protein